MDNILLPRVYTKEIWERNGKRKEHKKYIGMFYLSNSQISSFNSKSSYNTQILGRYEYMKQYFFGLKFSDEGYAEHGLQVEAYICYNNLSPAKFKKLDDGNKNDFNKAVTRLREDELERLRSIKPLGDFQHEVIVKLDNIPVVIMGFIDDMSIPDKDNHIEVLADYKTKSKSSKKSLHDKDVMQLELYTRGLEQDGFTVGRAEYRIIERVWKEGVGREAYNAFLAAGEDAMTEEDKITAKLEHLRVGENIWYEDYTRSSDPKRVDDCIKVATETAIQISELYKTYLKYFNNGR